MAQITFQVLGAGGTPLDLPVTVNPASILLNGLTTQSVQFIVSNPLDRDVTFTTINITVGGAAAPKVGALVRFDNFIVPAGGTFENFLDVESKEAIFEGETFDILVEGTEA